MKLIQHPLKTVFHENPQKANTTRKKACRKKRSKKAMVAAIVPVYNEGSRIAKVLEPLTRTRILGEIIVVDDGSSDNTRQEVKRFQNVKYLRNPRNRGKSYSMDRGVKATRLPVLFFCDGDVEGLTPETIEAIIKPVLRNEVGMFIGIRNNPMQKTFMTFAVNSGERALKRELWEALPAYYKHRFRVETGLNYLANIRGEGVGYKTFKHYHTIKEVKYGYVKGTFLRGWMNFDVAMALLRTQLLDRFKGR